jgi:hypothetical protein
MKSGVYLEAGEHTVTYVDADTTYTFNVEDSGNYDIFFNPVYQDY